MSFYAVKVGKIPGIYSTWTQCEAQVKGFSGAEHKKFKTSKEAELYIGKSGSPVLSIVNTPPIIPKVQSIMNLTPVIPKVSSLEETKDEYEVWTDGSALLGISAGFGFVIVKSGKIIKEGGGKINVKPFTAPQAEICAIVEGLRALYELVGQTLPPFTLYSDNEYTIKTINGINKGKKYAEEFANILEFVSRWRKTSTVKFVHVSGHSGLIYNERCDVLAKQYRCS
jgi:viroplasmin and RNaseH domain-containing protein